MNAIKFIQQNGVDAARMVIGCAEMGDVETPNIDDLKRLVESVDLVNNCGGLAIANKITFQKRLRNEKATHFIQHPENKKLIQLFGRNQCKPKEAIKFDLFEQAIADYESIYGGEHV
ncbi:hypothetical protein HMPREF0026_01338 [Acinetobacter junii SH205]|uniref:Uncharacterized protein n=1 Tax=Acinetobacter junii SH205 TaxID=575587 RepID=D0SJP0_ACIJU|nr:hypothetical protein [Acinetobacter junii]EEY94062.1 hypothetical protein HMPREF0026_01338 [Acinetobacter junii SH205]